MIHFIALYTLAPDVDESRLDELMRVTRSALLRIQEVHNVRSGKSVSAGMEYPFCLAIDFQSLDKLAAFRDDSVWLKLQRDHIDPGTSGVLELVYETEPGKNLKYS